MDLFEPADIIIYIQGRGIVLKEKSLLAIDKESGKILAYGEKARHMADNFNNNIKIISPLRLGAAADYIAAAGLFKCLLIKYGKNHLYASQPQYVYQNGLQKLKKKQ